MKELPKDVIDAKNYFLKNVDHDLYAIAEKLIINPPLHIQEELKKMWCEYIKHPPRYSTASEPFEFDEKTQNKLNELATQARLEFPEEFAELPIDRFVYGLLEDIKSFIDLPVFHKKSLKDRQDIAVEIKQLSDRLVHLLEVNEVDVFFHDITDDGCLLYIESLPRRPYVATSNLISNITLSAINSLTNFAVDAKDSKNKEAVKFARRYMKENDYFYKQPFYSRVAIITNAVYGTQYDKASVAQLRNRVGKDS